MRSAKVAVRHVGTCTFIKCNIFAQHQQKASGAAMGTSTGEQPPGGRGTDELIAHFRPAAAFTMAITRRTSRVLFLARGLHSDVCAAVTKHGSARGAGRGPAEPTRFVRVVAGRSGWWAAHQNSADNLELHRCSCTILMIAARPEPCLSVHPTESVQILTAAPLEQVATDEMTKPPTTELEKIFINIFIVQSINE